MSHQRAPSRWWQAQPHALNPLAVWKYVRFSLALFQDFAKQAKQGAVRMVEPEIAREEIRRMLLGFVEAPAALLREADFQAALWSVLRRRLDDGAPGLPVEVLSPSGAKTAHAYKGLTTGRVHAEMEVWHGGVKLAKPLDLAVLRGDSRPTILCERYGASDFWQRLRGEDLAVAIEVKASPSVYRDQPGKYVADLEKLAAVKRVFPAVAVMFVLFDKSLQLEGAGGPVGPVDWVRAQSVEIVGTAEPSDLVVEVWDLDPAVSPHRVRQRFWKVPSIGPAAT